MLRKDVDRSAQTVTYWDPIAPGFTATVQRESKSITWLISIQSNTIAPLNHMGAFRHILTAAGEAATYLNTYGWDEFPTT